MEVNCLKLLNTVVLILIIIVSLSFILCEVNVCINKQLLTNILYLQTRFLAMPLKLQVYAR